MEPDLEFDQSPEQCPSCAEEIQRASVICVNCGYHLVEGRHMQTVVADEKVRSAQAASKQPSSKLDEGVVNEAESIARDANWWPVVAALTFVTAGVGTALLLPWYVLRLRAWRRLSNKYPELSLPQLVEGDLAERYQGARIKLAIGTAVSCLMWVWIAFVAISTWNRYSYLFEEVDASRHVGAGRVRISGLNFSLVPPETWVADASDHAALSFYGPMYPWKVSTSHGAKVTQSYAVHVLVKAVRDFQRPPPDEFPNDIHEEIEADMPPNVELISQEFTTVDGKPALFMRTKMDVNGIPARFDDYFVIGRRKVYSIIFGVAEPAYRTTRPTFDEILASVRID